MFGTLQQGWGAKGRCGRKVGDEAGRSGGAHPPAHEVIRIGLELRGARSVFHRNETRPFQYYHLTAVWSVNGRQGMRSESNEERITTMQQEMQWQ